MFNRKAASSASKSVFGTQRVSMVAIEGLEDRRLMSGGGFGGGGRGPGGGGGGGHGGAAIEFSLLPASVQSGLDTLADSTLGTDTTIAATQKVQLGLVNGIATYSVVLQGTGVTSRITVDASGAAVTAPTKTQTTFGAITDTDVTGSLTSIAAALGLAAPASDAVVHVSTTSGGAATYSIKLLAATDTTTTTTGRRAHGTVVSVNAAGDIVGNARIKLGALSETIQAGLVDNAPTGATALTDDSIVSVRTLNGITTYSASYTATGVKTVITVNASGDLAALPSSSEVAFSTIPSAARTALQTLATANGVTDAIADRQVTTAFDTATGTVVYSVRLSATVTATDGTTSTRPISLAVDQDGNPTITPRGDGSSFGGGGFADCGPGLGGFGGAGFGRGRGGGLGRGGYDSTPVVTPTPTPTTPTTTPTATVASTGTIASTASARSAAVSLAGVGRGGRR